jgi:hypothetical protein
MTGAMRAAALTAALVWGWAAWCAPPNIVEVPLPAAGPGHSLVTLETRPGVTQRFLLIKPPRLRAGALLYTGGTGYLGIRPGGIENDGGLLLGGRDDLAARGVLIAVVDLPSDHDGPTGLTNLRTSEEHARDAAAIVRFLRRRGAPSVWAIGGSRGSVSAVNAAARLTGRDRPDGVVLISSLLRPAGPADSDVVFGVPLDRISGPALLVHHEQDACPATPYGDLPKLVQALRKARPLKVLHYAGGGPPTGAPCTAQHHHGFVNQQADVLRELGTWLLAHARRSAANAAPH